MPQWMVGCRVNPADSGSMSRSCTGVTEILAVDLYKRGRYFDLQVTLGYRTNFPVCCVARHQARVEIVDFWVLCRAVRK